MALFENFPYTNFHELNLDWVIQKIKEFNSKLNTAMAAKITVADPIQWDISKQYEQFTVVVDNNRAYLSIAPVPYGVSITDTDYWQEIFDLDQMFQDLKSAMSINDDGGSLTSSANRSVNDLVWLNDTLHVVTAPITLGDTYSSANVQEISIEAWVKALVSGLSTNLSALTAQTKRSRKAVILIGDSYSIDTEMWTGWIHAFSNEYGSVITVYDMGSGGSGFKQGNDDIPNFNTVLTQGLATMTAEQKNNVTDIIVVGGYNDVSRNATLSELKTLMSEFKNTALTACPYAKVSVGFCGVHYSSDSVMTRCRVMNGTYAEAAQHSGISVINNIILTLLNKSLLYTDAGNANRNFHPNTDGNKQLAMRIYNYIMTGSIGRVTYAEIISNTLHVYVEDGVVNIFTAGTSPFMPAAVYGVNLVANQWITAFDLADSNLLWFFSTNVTACPIHMCFAMKGGSTTDYTERVFFVRFYNNKMQMGNLMYAQTHTIANDTVVTIPNNMSFPWEAVY